MDLITHGVVGLALGSLSGGPDIINNPLAIGALIGSVVPDGDIIYQLKGDYTYLKNHRGPSHSIVMGTVISLIVSGILRGIFSDFSFWSIFVWTFGAYMLHIGLDIFNSYGASILWPFSKKKIGSGLLLIFDPALLISSIVIFFTRGKHWGWIIASISFFILYLLFRLMLKRRVYKVLMKFFNHEKGQKIVVMPSMLRLFKWDFIMYQQKRIITGRVNVLRSYVYVRNYFERSNTQLENIVLKTTIGEFFKNFSPHYHIEWIRDGEGHKVIFTDLRYYVRGSYMHHAIALFDEKLRPIYAAFQPYSKQRNIKIPV
ncbi:MAG: metal-dependent hydrolase [Caldicoprobacterales bacterium]|jgi:inner membrane protein|nr:metal-dependent hydrolase [Clostridiales bacterium]